MQRLNVLLTAALMVASVLMATLGVLWLGYARAAETKVDQGVAVAFLISTDAALLLQSRQAPCGEGTKRSLMFGRTSPVAYLGCWREVNGNIEITDEDGDSFTIPVKNFVWNGRPA